MTTTTTRVWKILYALIAIGGISTAASVAAAAEAADSLGPLDFGKLTSRANYQKTLPKAIEPLRVNVVEQENLGSGQDAPYRVGYLGSTLVERASQHGFLETELTRRWPDRDIIFRNLAWAGDTVIGTGRVGFGPGEERHSGWNPPKGEVTDYGFRKMLGQVKQARPDLLLVGYGSNVAFEKADGLEEFRGGMIRLLDALKPTGVHIVLLTPAPRESRPAPWPDMGEQNSQLAKVAALIGKLGQERNLQVIDLFAAMKPRMEESAKAVETRLTDNGIHLNERGYRLWSELVASELAAEVPQWQVRLSAVKEEEPKVVTANEAEVTRLHRNRYGLRMQIRDARLPSQLMAAADGSRDKEAEAASRRVLRVDGLPAGSYALDIDGQRVARGSAADWAAGVAIDRGPHLARAEELRAAIVEKNRLFAYGFRPQNETYIFLFRRHERGHHEGEISQFAALAGRAEEEIARLRQPPTRFYELVREANYNEYSVPKKAPEPSIEKELELFTVADDLEVSLFASDPMIANPININWDERGRMWVSTSSIYPHLAPGQKPDDRIVILEDIDQDGRADKSTLFAEDLLIPHSAIMSKGGVYVTQSTDFLYLKDTDGDDRADTNQVIFTGFGNADMHHTIHSLRWGPGGDLYFHQAIYIHSHIETPWGVRNLHGSGLWRLRPDTMRLEVVSRGLVNPWGNAFDRWGQTFATDGAGGGGIAYSFPGSAFTSAKGVPRILRSMNPGRPKECGLEIVSGRHLPESWQGQLVTADFRGNQVVRYELSESGSGYRSRLVGNVLSSKHRSFRPVDIKMGPDGAIYVVDWYSPIIQHGEVDFHHPQRDRKHGRIWRLTAKNRKTLKRPDLVNASADELLEMLRLPEDWTRDQARRLLREMGPEVVLPRLRAWLADLDPQAEDYLRWRLEGLWLYQGLRHVEPELLRANLTAENHRVRAASVRVLLDWYNKMPAADELLALAARDEHPQVRLEAVNALREVPSLASATAAMTVLEQPIDESLEFATWLTARELAPYWLTELEAGKPVFGNDARQLAFALTAVGGQRTLKHIRDLIGQERITDRQRGEMLAVLASEGGATVRAMVVDELMRLAAAGSKETEAVLHSLVRASRSRGARPKNAEKIAALLASGSSPRITRLAAELSGNWQIAKALPRLIQMAGDVNARRELRDVAALALARIEGTGSDSNVRKLAAVEQPLPVRVSAYAAWSLVDPVAAATPAAELLGSLEADTSVAYVTIIEAFLARERADRKLAEALAGKKLPAAIAAAGVRAASEAGRDVTGLIDAFTTAGGLTPITELPSGDEMKALLAAVEKADPHRGEAIFRRTALTCLQCHAIGGAGGHVGPDLSSLGGSAQPGQILESILSPSATIKEGYQTVSLFGNDGRVTSGIVAHETPDSVTLRDSKGQMIQFARSEIDEIEPSRQSLRS